MRLQPRPIASETQLLVEGRDSEGFFEAMTEHLKLQDVQVQNFGGVPDLRKFLHTFVRLSDFSQVTNIGIVRDAEGSAPSAFKSVQGALEHAGLPVPERTGERQGGHPGVTVMILPDSNRSGMLETLLWDTIQDDEVRGCIDAFFECVEELQAAAMHRPDKARARAFLATKRDAHLSVGNAAKRGYWNLDHAALDPIREFLREIAARH